jgi:Cu(I)/Ag(I) efflux system periplasmic protein CusF
MTTLKTSFAAIALAALTVSAASALAQSAGTLGAAPATTAPAAAADMTDAVVRKIDKDQGKLTLKHGPIKNLDMPGMTMVFSVRDKAALDTLKPGDKVKFTALDDKGKLTVVDLVRAD